MVVGEMIEENFRFSKVRPVARYLNVTASLSFSEILSLMLVFILVMNGATIHKS